MPKQRNRTRRSAPKDNRGGVLGKLIVMLAVVAAVVFGVAIFFRVNQIEVQGNKIYSAQQVAEISGVETGDNLLMVNKPAVVGNIYAKLPYVQTVSVGRVLPDTVVIRVQESEIAGLVTSDVGSTWYINTQGRILGSGVEGFDGQIVELTGFTITAPKTGENAVASVDMEDSMDGALEVLSKLEGTGLIGLVTSVNAEKSFDLKVLCGEQYEVQMGSSDALDYKVWCLQEVIEQLDDYQMGIIDLSKASEHSVRFIPWE